MNRPYEIVYSVLEAYRGLAVKLSRITGKSEQWFRSHGYDPTSDTGNRSETDGFMSQCELYEAAEPGAGRMLASRVYEELTERFTERDLKTTGRDLLCGVVIESSDVEKWLAKHDPNTASRNELIVFLRECDEAIEAIHEAKSTATVRLKEIQLMRQQAQTNGRAH